MGRSYLYQQDEGIDIKENSDNYALNKEIQQLKTDAAVAAAGMEGLKRELILAAALVMAKDETNAALKETILTLKRRRGRTPDE
jgi:hypothetical protein